MEKVISAFRSYFSLAPLAGKLLIGQGLRRQRLIFLIQIGVISLATASALLILNASYSFREAITQRLYSYLGQLWVRYYGEEQENRPLPIDRAYVESLRREGCRIESAIHLPMLIESAAGRYEGVNLVGVGPSWWHTAWGDVLIQPVPTWGGDTMVVLSRRLAERLGVRVGDKVTAVWLADPPRLRRLRVVALYQVGLEEIDRHTGFIPIEMAQRLLAWDSTQVQIAHIFPGPAMSDSLIQAVSWKLPYLYEIVPVEAIFPDIFDWLGLIEQNVQVILGIVLGLSFFSGASAFLVLQFAQRLRYELCWALGASARRLWSLTFFQACMVTGIGMGIGFLMALGLLGSQAVWGWIRLDPENYLIATLPVYWYGGHLWGVVGVGVVGAFLLTVMAYPRRRWVRLLTQTE